MKTYYITSTSEISEYSYQEGQLGYVNSYDHKGIVTAENAKSASWIYLVKELGYYSIADGDIEFEADGYANTSVLVNEENSEASKSELELWEDGKKTLYIDDIRLTVYKLEQVTFN